MLAWTSCQGAQTPVQASRPVWLPLVSTLALLCGATETPTQSGRVPLCQPAVVVMVVVPILTKYPSVRLSSSLLSQTAAWQFASVCQQPCAIKPMLSAVLSAGHRQWGSANSEAAETPCPAGGWEGRGGGGSVGEALCRAQEAGPHRVPQSGPWLASAGINASRHSSRWLSFPSRTQTIPAALENQAEDLFGVICFVLSRPTADSPLTQVLGPAPPPWPRPLN